MDNNLDKRGKRTPLPAASLFGQVQQKIIVLRDYQVILDADVAELYGVETREVNQAVRNNQEKFKASITKTESMESSYKLLNEQFENGLKNVVELLTGKDDLLQAQQEKLQSKYTTLLNIQLLKFYQGNSMTL